MMIRPCAELHARILHTMDAGSLGAARGVRRFRNWLPAVAWAALIFAFSAQPNLRFVPDELLDFVVRKLGHMAVFGILALLLWRAVATTTAWRQPWAWALVLTVLYAMTDELHQSSVTGRHASAVDVGIDAAGVLIALTAVGIVGVRRAPATPTPDPCRSANSGLLARATDHGRDRPEQDLEVQPERPAVDVGEVAARPTGRSSGSWRASTCHRPVIARLHAQAPAVPDVVLVDLARERRARPDEAHLALEHVPQLRQLVDARPAQDGPRPGDPAGRRSP